MIDDDQAADEIEQYSPESRRQLQDRAVAVATVLERHTAALLELRGGSGTLPTLFQLNDEIRQALVDWDDAVFDHSGTFPVALEPVDNEDGEDDKDDAQSGADSSETSLAVSVMSRWDLDIVDPASLIAAGHQAHQRMNPSDTELNAATSLSERDVGRALYAIVHEYGDPWFELPGVGRVTGYRAYLHRDDDQPSLGEGNQGYDEPPATPSGSVLYSESW